MTSGTTKRTTKVVKKEAVDPVASPPTLLAGGNPQIAKADGEAPVNAYIEAMPGWKRDVGRRLDELISRNVPSASKAIRWNSPMYGIRGRGWFLSFHCVTGYIKVAFFNGTSLRPLPPVESKNAGTRYLHIRENEPIDDELLSSWVRQAAELPPGGPWRSSGEWVP